MTAGLISEKIILLGDKGEPEIFEAWAERTGLDMDALINTGCGCCVDIYTVQATPEQLVDLRAQLAAVRNR